MASQTQGQGGYHISSKGDWRKDASNVDMYYPGDLLHSWARGANISKAAFKPCVRARKGVALQGRRSAAHKQAWSHATRARQQPFPFTLQS